MPGQYLNGEVWRYIQRTTGESIECVRGGLPIPQNVSPLRYSMRWVDHCEAGDGVGAELLGAGRGTPKRARDGQPFRLSTGTGP